MTTGTDDDWDKIREMVTDTQAVGSIAKDWFDFCHNYTSVEAMQGWFQTVINDQGIEIIDRSILSPSRGWLSQDEIDAAVERINTDSRFER